MRRYNVKDRTLRERWHPVRRSYALIYLRPPVIAADVSQQQAHVEGHLLAARQSAGIATKDTTSIKLLADCRRR